MSNKKRLKLHWQWLMFNCSRTLSSMAIGKSENEL